MNLAAASGVPGMVPAAMASLAFLISVVDPVMNGLTFIVQWSSLILAAFIYFPFTVLDFLLIAALISPANVSPASIQSSLP